jgi:DNA polymerase
MSTAASSQLSDTALHALLGWYREMGIDAAVSEASIDWLTRGDVRPGADYELQRSETAPSPASRNQKSAPVSADPGARPAVKSHAVPPWMDANSQPPPTAPPPQHQRPPGRVAPIVAPLPRATSPARQFPTATPDAATITARTAAQSAKTIEALRDAIAAFDGCALKATAKSLCFYRGAVPARVMVIGEAPGADDDKLGKPFLGLPGQMLDKMLAAIGLDEGNTHITNIVYWRPPGNRPPTPQEAQVCRPFLERQIELVQPEILLLLGGGAANNVLDTPEGIMKLRGVWREVECGKHRARALATIHPINLVSRPVSKRMAWHDLLAVEAALK